MVYVKAITQRKLAQAGKTDSETTDGDLLDLLELIDTVKKEKANGTN